MSVFRYLDTEELEVRNPLFLLHTESDNTFTDVHDIGFVGQYYDGSNIVYTGLFRDASDSGKYKLFQSLQVLPTVDTGAVNTAGAGYALASLDLQNLNASGNVVITGDLTVNGTTTAVNAETLLVEDNIIVANAGPANMKEDGGFVVRRVATNVDDDTPKQTGTASASGSTTTITLQASNGHGTTLDYYKGWIIKLGVTSTETVTVTSSTAADPPVLTFTPAASVATDNTTTYQLFNKQHVGMIYDESTDLLTFYGFPREDLVGTVSTTDPNGNLADFINIKANSISAEGTVTAVGNISSSTGSVSAATSVSAGTTITATGNISSTTGSVSAATSVSAGTTITATGNISSTTGSVSAATTITAGTGLTVTTGDLNVSSGNAIISGNLSVGGVINAPVKIDDNILAINTGPNNLGNDGGFVTQRTPANIVAQDTAAQTGTASAAGTTTTITLQAANGHYTTLDAYEGWVIEFGGDVTGTALVTGSTAADPPVLTFTPAASGATTTSTTYELFNKRYVGTIYDESTDTLMAVGFPREDGEGVIDPLSPVNGNLPSYLNFAVNNLTVNGSFNLVGGTTLATKTQVAGVTFVAGDILNYEIIYLNPSANTTYTLPLLSSLALAANTSKIIIFVNINATNRATISRNGSNTIEGLTTLALNRQWSKTVLVASDQQPSTWMIKG
jgi:hypothetical protein